MTVNFMCQFDWAITIWSNIILGVSVMVFLDEINIEYIDWAKQIAVPNTAPTQSIEDLPE